MLFRNMDRFCQRIPGLRGTYLNHYGTIRSAFYNASEKLGIIRPPRYVHWLATYECNFRCRHCGANAGERPAEELATEHIIRAVEDMGHMGVGRLIITGGEPLLRKDVFDVLDAAKTVGIPNLTLATNGFLVEAFERQLNRVGLSTVHVSIDGLTETNDKMRGRQGAAVKAWKALRFFAEAGVGERILNTLVYKGNVHELETFFEEVINSPATLWNIQLPHTTGRAKNHRDIVLDKEETTFLFNFLLRIKDRFPIQLDETAGYLGPLDPLLRPVPFFCGAGVETCSIMPDGAVLGCHVTYDYAYAEGNIKEADFSTIWKRKFNRFASPQLPAECHSCRYFGACRGSCGVLRGIHGGCRRDIWTDGNPSLDI